MSLLFSYPSIEPNSLKLPSIETFPLQTCPNTSSMKNLKKSQLKPKYKKVVLPPLLSCREVELVNNLSMDSTEDNNPLSNSLLQAKEKERIETSTEIINKRKGIKTENSDLQIQGISAIEKEFKSSHSKEFYIKYETLQKEKKMEDDIMNAKKEIEGIKQRKNKLYENMIDCLSKIYNCELDIKIIDNDEYFATKKNEALSNLNVNVESETQSQIASPSRHRKKLPKKKLDSFVLKTLNMKEQTMRNEKKNEINQIKTNYGDRLKEIRTEIQSLKETIDKKKRVLKINVRNLLDHYHQILFKGLDARQEGLMWVIKAIWNLGENVQMSFFPSFLDSTSIDYLFTVAHKNVEISQLKCEIEKNKMELHLEFSQLEKANSKNKDMAYIQNINRTKE